MPRTPQRPQFEWSNVRNTLLSTCVSIVCAVQIMLFVNMLMDSQTELLSIGSVIVILGIIGLGLVFVRFIRNAISHFKTCVQTAHLL